MLVITTMQGFSVGIPEPVSVLRLLVGMARGRRIHNCTSRMGFGLMPKAGFLLLITEITELYVGIRGLRTVSSIEWYSPQPICYLIKTVIFIARNIT